MPKDRLSSPSAEDLIWLCRRLGSALQAGASVAPAIEQVCANAPEGAAAILRGMKRTVALGHHAARALEEAGAPAYVSVSVSMGQARANLAGALPAIADRLEVEQSTARPPNTSLYSRSLVLGRLGLMLGLGVSALDALVAAAESLPDSTVSLEIQAARDAVRSGASLSDALQRHCPSLPDLTIDMIRDAEREGRLGDALPVIADYLLDAAGEAKPRRRKQEVRNGS